MRTFLKHRPSLDLSNGRITSTHERTNERTTNAEKYIRAAPQAIYGGNYREQLRYMENLNDLLSELTTLRVCWRQLAIYNICCARHAVAPSVFRCMSATHPTRRHSQSSNPRRIAVP